MRRGIFVACLFIANLFSIGLFATELNVHVNKQDVYDGFISQRIWLTNNVLPEVSISDISYKDGVILPKESQVSDPHNFQLQLGMERKRAFVVIRVPVFVSGKDQAGISMVSDFKLTITEKSVMEKGKSVEKTTDVSSSVLSIGKWYKVGITQTGFYKIDYNFLVSLGVVPDSINPAKIRIFGNGGNMLSENNIIQRPSDLIENAIYVSASGSKFSAGSYIIFYGVGPTAWTVNSGANAFNHKVNLYSDTAFYFINFDKEGGGLRIQQQSTPPSANTNVTTYDYYDYHELDLISPAGIGKNWYGEQFNPILGNLTQNFSFHPGSYIDSVLCTTGFYNSQDVLGSSYNVLINNNPFGTIVFNSTTTGDNVINPGFITKMGNCFGNDINVTINFNPASQNSLGYLDYIEINARRSLQMNGEQMSFRDLKGVGAGKVASYNLQGSTGSIMVWDITNRQVPILMTGSLSGNIFTFVQDAQTLHEFAAFNSLNLFTPKFMGKVTNQNLHGSPQVDCIIVTAEDFLEQATKLAEHHRTHDNFRVIVATTNQIYNEFSSGSQDISAIRDFERMFYIRAGNDTTQMPRYLILFGGASYDYKHRLPNNSNFVPVFESATSVNNLSSYSSDDFYGYLDDSEYIEDSRIKALDIAVGRLPARNQEDANNLFNKISTYTSTQSLGPWRLSALFTADNNDQAGDHMNDAEDMAATVTNISSNLYNERKVYLDALSSISTPAGVRCPTANSEIDDQMYKGTFISNYNGHGNTEVWAGERILTQDDYNNWNNGAKLPFMVTATCDFGQFDHPQYVSAAEQLTNLKNAGAIALLTTTQAVYAVYNHTINVQYLISQFSKKTNGVRNTFGDAFIIGKNTTYIVETNQQKIVNFRKFALLGDPSVTPAFPRYGIVIDSVLDGATNEKADTVKALGAYIIKGKVIDDYNTLLSSFNGDLFMTIYDKPRNILTISGTNQIFQMQDNVIYKGRGTVTNGEFSIKFIAPKDINYFLGKGKISTYAQTSTIDAAGSDTSFVVGEFSDNPVLNNNPPIVQPFINDSMFRNGGITGSNTSLFVILNDETGINVSGNSVGHDLKAVLDDNVEQPYILNDFYETAPNTYKIGYVSYPLQGLPDGRHKIVVTAWDVNDNTGSGEVDFIVINGRIVDIQNLGNYPNPFDNLTHFVFEHNHPFENLKVQIEIYNAAGAIVKKIEDSYTPVSSWSNDITWDGRDENGVKVSSGVYVYRLNITSERGFISSAYQKLVIVR